MKRAGHKLAVGSRSLVGQATANNAPVISNNTRTNVAYYPNPLLPETRSEAVVPLAIGKKVLGALDVQSERVDAFSDEDVHTLEILADQLAMAIENAALFARTQENLAKHRLLHQITTAVSTSQSLDEALEKTSASLRTALNVELVLIFLQDRPKHLFVPAALMNANPDQDATPSELVLRAAQEHKVLARSSARGITSADDAPVPYNSEIAVPILFSDDFLGVLDIASNQLARFDENDQEILGALGDSLGGVITNTRLMDRIRQQVERQRLLYEITSKIRRSVDIESILKTSAAEIGKALDATRVSISINSTDDLPGSRSTRTGRFTSDNEAGNHDKKIQQEKIG